MTSQSDLHFVLGKAIAFPFASDWQYLSDLGFASGMTIWSGLLSTCAKKTASVSDLETDFVSDSQIASGSTIVTGYPM